MGRVTAIVDSEFRDELIALEHLEGMRIVREASWGAGLYFLAIDHPEAPDGRHVDVILDEEGLRFKVDQDV